MDLYVFLSKVRTYKINLSDAIKKLKEWKNEKTATCDVHSDCEHHELSNVSFEQYLKEEFLVNTQNYPKEYHELFQKKFGIAEKRYNEHISNQKQNHGK